MAIFPSILLTICHTSLWIFLKLLTKIIFNLMLNFCKIHRKTANWIHFLKVHQRRFENLSICLCSYENNTLKTSYSESQDFSSYLPVHFVFFWKGRLLFNVFYWFCISVNKHLAYLRCAYLKGWKVLWCPTCVMLVFIWRRMYCKNFISA